MIDRYEYLKHKAEAVGLQLMKATSQPSQGYEIFLLGNTDACAGLSMWGLDSLQNASDDKIRDLMDARFNASLKTFRKFSGNV